MDIAAPLTIQAALAFFAIALFAAVLTFRRTWCAPAIVLASAPFAWYHQLGPTEITVPKAAFVGAALGLIAVLARDPMRRARAFEALRDNRALWPLVALAVWSMASALWAGTAADAVRDALKWVWYAGSFALTIAALDRDQAGNLKVLGVMFAAAAVVGLDGLWQNATSAPSGFYAPGGAVVGRIAATLEGPNQFGAYLESAIGPLLAVLLFTRMSWWLTVVASLLLGVLWTDLLLTYSRGSLLSCIAGVTFLAAAYLRLRREGNAAPATVPAIVVACVALVVAPIAHKSIGAPGWAHDLGTPPLTGQPDPVVRREQLWTCAVQLFTHHPVAGVGAGNFADAKQDCPAALAGQEHTNANEWYMETAADLGAVGLIMLAAFLLALLASAGGSRMWRDPAAIGAYAVVIAFVLHGFVDDVMPYPKAALSFFVLAAMIPPNVRAHEGKRE